MYVSWLTGVHYFEVLQAEMQHSKSVYMKFDVLFFYLYSVTVELQVCTNSFFAIFGWMYSCGFDSSC